MKCLEIARLQDFAPFTQGLLGAFSRAKTPCRIERTPLWNFCLRAWAKVASCCKNFHFNFLCNPDIFSRSHKRTTSVPAAESCTPWFRINKRKPCLTERHFYMSVFDGYGIASSVRPSVCPGLVGWTVSPMILQVSTSDQHGERKMPNCFSRSEIKVQGCIVT